MSILKQVISFPITSVTNDTLELRFPTPESLGIRVTRPQTLEFGEYGLGFSGLGVYGCAALKQMVSFPVTSVTKDSFTGHTTVFLVLVLCLE